MILKDFKEKLEYADEHYPVVDEFVKGYQQSPTNKNGYIYHAWEERIIIDRLNGEPNQKWHLFDAYLGQDNFEDSMDAGIIYNRIKCPELKRRMRNR